MTKATATFATALFVFTEIMFFGGLVSAYIVLRSSFANWPPVGQPTLPLAATAANSLVLLASGAVALTWHRSLSNPSALWRRLFASFVGGAVFVVVQGFEWARLIAAGLSASASVYGALFTAIVGAHAIHVLGALVVLGVFAERARNGRLSADSWDGLGAIRMYWLFVVLLWPVLYALVYLW